MIKVLVFGIHGMAGSTIYKYLRLNSQLETRGTSSHKENADFKFLVDKDFRVNLSKFMSLYKPDYVVNCIGYIRPKMTLEDYEKSIMVNSVFPKYLSQYCILNNIRMIHMSTDCVFNGETGSYSDSYLPNENSLYGVSKYLGETTEKPNITIRTSIIGKERGREKNLLDWFLNTKEKNVEGYSNVYWNGITTLVLAKLMERIIINGIVFDKSLIQIASQNISKFELLQLFKKLFNKEIEIKKNISVTSNKTLLPSSEQNIYFSDLIIPLEKQIEELIRFINI